MNPFENDPHVTALIAVLRTMLDELAGEEITAEEIFDELLVLGPEYGIEFTSRKLGVERILLALAILAFEGAVRRSPTGAWVGSRWAR